mgnify:CR=1 FL=1
MTAVGPHLDKHSPPGSPPPSQEEAEARLHREGYTCYCWYDVPGTIYPGHQHSHDECIWLLKGEMEYEVGGQIFELKAGDRLFLPKGTAHTAKVPKSMSVTFIVGQKKLS